MANRPYFPSGKIKNSCKTISPQEAPVNISCSSTDCHIGSENDCTGSKDLKLQSSTSLNCIQSVHPTSSATSTVQRTKSATELQVPKVFFCSRTHAQLKQVIKELQSCSIDYISDIKMCILGARTQYCINNNAKAKAKENSTTLNDICQDMAKNFGCRYSRNLKPLLEVLKKSVVWDIEDAVTKGRRHEGCPYLASKTMLEDADYVFAPYNYIIDAGIRSAMNINLQNSIVIIDEAHNMEDICRDAASAEIGGDTLRTAVFQLMELSKSGNPAFKAFLQLLSRLETWMKSMEDIIPSDSSNNINKNNFMKEQNEWDGVEAIDIFERHLGLTFDTLQVYQQHLQDIIQQQDDLMTALLQFDSSEEEEEPLPTQHQQKIPSFTLNLLKGLFVSLNHLLNNNGVHAADFRVVLLKRTVFSNNARKEVIDFNIWCLNAAVVFRYEIIFHC